MKFRIAVVCSVVWFFFILSDTLRNGRFHSDEFILMGAIPLITAWGIWWIVKGKKEDETKKQ